MNRLLHRGLLEGLVTCALVVGLPSREAHAQVTLLASSTESLSPSRLPDPTPTGSFLGRQFDAGEFSAGIIVTTLGALGGVAAIVVVAFALATEAGIDAYQIGCALGGAGGALMIPGITLLKDSRRVVRTHVEVVLRPAVSMDRVGLTLAATF